MTFELKSVYRPSNEVSGIFTEAPSMNVLGVTWIILNSIIPYTRPQVQIPYTIFKIYFKPQKRSFASSDSFEANSLIWRALGSI